MFAKTDPTMADVWGMALGPALLDFHAPRQWRALTVRPTYEQKAADFLKTERQWVYWPCFVDQVHAGGHRRGQCRVRRAVFRAVMPGYLFLAVHPDSGDPWSCVHATPGITGFVRDGGGHAAALTDRDIDIIRMIEAGLNLPHDPMKAHRHKPGDKVRFVDDTYSRWPPSIVRRLAEDGRIVLETLLLGRIVPILAYPHQIEAM
ncbi:transcription termination/antitermination NusG family protein [Bradyrhizobium sp.]|uniref:transcription termination/antitermination protein NusG n=1 Tax=Bradyrhizobium sp. TaxID=376 RepID=UPI0025C2DDD5|nr:transcription termination/antitermination NusG family protein [Bradyrhizobium sp.]